MTSSIYALPITPTAGAIGIGADLIDGPIVITTEQVSPGGGGILRLYFALDVVGDVATTVEVLNNSLTKGFLNADNSRTIEDEGYYRFDIDIEAGDSINLESTVALTGIRFLRAHLVQFGA